MSGKRRRRSRGHTLLELSVVVVSAAMILSLVALALRTMYRIEQQARRQMATDAAISRLAAQFRADAHAAVRGEIEQSGNEQQPADQYLLLAMPDERRIEYRARPSRIDRTVREGQAVLHRDAYRLPDVSAQFELQDEPPMSFASVAVWLGESASKVETAVKAPEKESADGDDNAAPATQDPLANNQREPSRRAVRIDAAIGLDQRDLVIEER